MYLQQQPRQISIISVLTIAAIASTIALTLLAVPSAHADSPSTGTSQLNIISATTSGQLITGYYTVLYQNDAVLSTGYSPANFTLTNGQTYTVVADNYGSCSFAYWSDNGWTGPQQLSIDNNTSIVAFYNCSTTSITIQSVNQNGDALPGYFATVWQNGALYAGVFTSATVPVFTGQTYSVLAENYGSCAFSNWSSGSTSNPLTVDVSGPGQTLVAVYDCTT